MSEPQIPDEIKAQTADRLLTLFAQLTHQIHANGMREGGTVKDRTARDVDTANKRAQRDVVRREIIRRCEAL